MRDRKSGCSQCFDRCLEHRARVVSGKSQIIHPARIDDIFLVAFVPITWPTLNNTRLASWAFCRPRTVSAPSGSCGPTAVLASRHKAAPTTASVDGQLERAKRQISIRGLNRNHNHDLKNLFKGAAIVASHKPGPFQEFYTALLAKGIRPEMARLTLARKIAAITLIVWKKGVRFDAQYLKPQAA